MYVCAQCPQPTPWTHVARNQSRRKAERESGEGRVEEEREQRVKEKTALS